MRKKSNFHPWTFWSIGIFLCVSTMGLVSCSEEGEDAPPPQAACPTTSTSTATSTSSLAETASTTGEDGCPKTMAKTTSSTTSTSSTSSTTSTTSSSATTTSTTTSSTSTCTNSAPTVSCTNSTQSLAKSASPSSITCTGSDSDGCGATLSYSISGCESAFAISSSGVVSGSMPGMNGCTATVTVSDGTYSGTAALTFTRNWTADPTFQSSPQGLSGFTGLIGTSPVAAAITSSNIWIADSSYGVAKSSDGMSSWSVYTTAEGLVQNWISDMWVADANKVYVATFYGTGYTTDGGTTWSSDSTVTEAIAGLSNGDGSYTIYGACNSSCAVRVSENSGTSWADRGTDPGQLEHIAVLDHDSDNALTDHVIILGLYQGVTISTDSGSNWTSVLNSSDTTYAVAAVAVSGTTYYLQASGTKVLLSSDGGSSWSDITTSNGLANNAVSRFIVDGSTVYAAHSYSSNLSYSTDGGQNWSTYSGRSGSVVAKSSDNTKWLKTSSSALYYSTDSGSNYSSFTLDSKMPGYVLDGPIYGNSTYVFAASDKYTGNGLFISSDDGKSWSRKTTTTGMASNKIQRIYADDSLLIVGHYNAGASLSTDNGSSFSSFTTSEGLASNAVSSVWGYGSNLYVGTSSGLSVSTNQGSSWTTKTTSDGLGSNTVNAVWGQGSTKVYVATAAGVGVSTDGGSSFTNYTTSNGLYSNTVNAIQYFNSKLYAMTASGISVSSDDGANWSNLTSNKSTWMHGRDSVIMMGENQRTYISTDAGASWSTWYNSNALTQGLPGYASRDNVFVGERHLWSSSSSGLGRSN